jgi:phage FluMu protein gp41
MPNLKDTLKHGLQVGPDLLRDFELRPAVAGDMFDAEEAASPDKPLAYRGALIGRQLVRLGNMEGPIPFDLVRKLHPEDFGQLVDALEAVEAPGKPASSDSGDTTSASSS